LPVLEQGKQMMGPVSKATLTQMMYAKEWLLLKQIALWTPPLKYPPTPTKSDQIKITTVYFLPDGEYHKKFKEIIHYYSHECHPLQEL